MNKIVTLFVAAAVVMFAASCNKADMDCVGEMVTLDCQVNLSDAMTKAFGDGSTVDKLACAVYEGETLYASATVDKADSKFIYAPSLYYGKTYTVVFFAYKDGAYTVNEGLTAITRKENGEAADAFTLKETVKINADGTLVVNGETTEQTVENHSVTLTRPFAQLNIGTESLEDLTKVGAAQVKVTLTGVASSYSAVSGSCTGTATVEYTSTIADFSSSNFSVKVDETTTKAYALVSLNYLFVSDNVTATIQTLNSNSENIRTLTISNFPLGANKKTNVYGNLVKGCLKFNVSVNAGFTTPDNEREIAQ